MKHGQILALGAAIAITAGGFVATATPAFAAQQVVVHAPSEDVPVRLVRFADLDLTLASGRKVLHRRVGSAVFDVCEGSESYATFQSDGFCRTAAWKRADPQIARAVERAQQLALNGVAPTGEQAIVITL